jgi:RNA polymerase sigma-70 factor, ECF subfamily
MPDGTAAATQTHSASKQAEILVTPARPPCLSIDDAALLRACAARDKAAVELLFHRHHKGLRAFLGRLVGRDCAELDDLVQQTFLVAVANAARFSGRSSVRTWIYGIAANKARDHHRRVSSPRNGRRVNDDAATARARCEEADAVQMEKRTPVCSAPRAPGAGDALISKQAAAELLRAVSMLSGSQRDAFVLCEVNGLAGADAAAKLGVPTGTLWRWLSEARAQLRKVLC